MEEIKFSIWKEKYEKMTERVRVGCRGIIIEDGKILLSYEAKNDWYFIPGGGLEEGETLEEGCVREVAEETAFLAEPRELLATVDGYYRERIFRNHFFLCRRLGLTRQNLTEAEAGNEMVPKWIPLEEAIRIFSGYKAYEEAHEMLCESYIRDYRILTEVLPAWSQKTEPDT